MSKFPRKKHPIRIQISKGAIAMLCVLTIVLSACSGFSSSPAPSTIDANAISTMVIETAVAISLQTQSAQSPTPENTPTEYPTETQVALPTATSQPQAVAAPGASCIPGNPPQTGKVVAVVDGDTIKVLLDQDGLTYSVRYIGMDTPENTSQVEYFGAEASAKNTELVYGKTVTLYKDVSETDQYNRLLRYVVTDDIFINYELVAQGYANTASYPPDTSCIPTFQAAEQQASSAKLGLWAAPPTATLFPTFAPLPTQAASGSSSGSGPCNCYGPDLDCKDFSTHAAAQACYDHCVSLGLGNIFRLDGNDKDGLACESLP